MWPQEQDRAQGWTLTRGKEQKGSGTRDQGQEEEFKMATPMAGKARRGTARGRRQAGPTQVYSPDGTALPSHPGYGVRKIGFAV